jgi:hypothetical protein
MWYYVGLNFNYNNYEHSMIINVFYAEDSTVNYKVFQKNIAKFLVPALQEKLR